MWVKSPTRLRRARATRYEQIEQASEKFRRVMGENLSPHGLASAGGSES